MPEAEYRNEGQTFERKNEPLNKRTNKHKPLNKRTIGDHDLKIAKRGKQK
jgi:hypothetical protein